MNNREKDLERRLAKCQRLWIDSENRCTERTALLILAQLEILKLEFGDDFEIEEPELYEKVKKFSGE